MEMHQIRYFLAVSRTLNFTRAAEECNVAQPSLTRAIQKLEQEIGGELFRRERARTHMTDLGRAILPMLSASYEGVIAAKAQAAKVARAEAGSLRLGISETIALELLLPALEELVRAFPGLELHLFRAPAGEVEHKLADGELDLAVTASGDRKWERIDLWPLFSEPLVAALHKNHPLAGKPRLTLENLKRNTLFARPYCEGSEKLTAWLRERHFEAGNRHRVSDEDDLARLVGADFGIAIVPRSAVRQIGNAVPVPIEECDLERSVALLAVAGRRYSRPAATLIRLLRAADWSAYEE